MKKKSTRYEPSKAKNKKFTSALQLLKFVIIKNKLGCARLLYVAKPLSPNYRLLQL